MIHVFVVDDSAFTRRALTRVLGAAPDIKVVGEARSGEEALEKIPTARPDVVTLDVEMPGLNGLATLRALLAWKQKLPVIMLSAHTQEGAEATVDALASGAVDFIDKTSFSVMDLEALGRELLDKIRIWGTVGLRHEARRHGPGRLHASVPPIAAERWDVLVLGASTGGPQALQIIIGGLPADFPLPVAVVQHMPPGFTSPFAERLNRVARVRVREAADGDRLVPGGVWIAPAGRHFRLNGKLAVLLSADAGGARHVPSVDVLLKSAAKARPGSVAAVLLTGMGEDGAEGMGVIHAQGGLTVAESEETCAVYGMPRAAIERGAVQHVLTLDEIAAWLAMAGTKKVGAQGGDS